MWSLKKIKIKKKNPKLINKENRLGVTRGGMQEWENFKQKNNALTSFWKFLNPVSQFDTYAGNLIL